MCGIAGYFGTKLLPKRRIERCLRLMKHRGPDNHDWRHWAPGDGRNAYLLHTRLNIIDLNSRANQPFEADGKWIAFNGELYNYKELRSGLQSSGVRFNTESDTEVLIRAIARNGWDALDRCEGMWAFAVYDEAERTMTLCRDRFGEKPLYLHRDGGGVYFGSEIKFIFCLKGQQNEINYNHLNRYLVLGYKSLNKQPETFFKGIEELPAGSCLSFDNLGHERSWRYWTFAYKGGRPMAYQSAVEESRELLIRSVGLRLRSDVPVAFCMSGGVDSNALIGIAKKVHGYDVHGFTIVDNDPRHDESGLAGLAASELGVRHTKIPVTSKDFLGQLRTLVKQHDSPVYTINYYAHWMMMRCIAGHGYRISVSGAGADELFSGYYDHHLFYLHELRNDKRALARAQKNWETHVKPYVRNPYLQDPKRFIKDAGGREHIYLNADIFRTFLTTDWNESFHEEHFSESPLRNRMLNELFHEAVPPILHEDDLNSMSCSIENRSPYLDRSLFEFLLSVPERHLVRDGQAKAILRDAVRGIAPDQIINNRRKVGFNASILSFLDVANRSVKASLLDDSPIFDIIRRRPIEKILAKPDLANSESKFLFYFICAKMFVEEYA